jgi:hypothetical protein
MMSAGRNLAAFQNVLRLVLDGSYNPIRGSHSVSIRELAVRQLSGGLLGGIDCQPITLAFDAQLRRAVAFGTPFVL